METIQKFQKVLNLLIFLSFGLFVVLFVDSNYKINLVSVNNIKNV